MTLFARGLLIGWMVLAGTGAVGQTPNPEHQLEDPRWYWNINTGAVVPDSALQPDKGVVVDLRIGKPLTGRWTLEAEYFRNEYDSGMETDPSYRGAGINLLQMNYEPAWNPYFLMGLGIIQHRSPLGDTASGVVNVAIGGSWYLLGDNVRLRVEGRWRVTVDDAGLSDQSGGQFTLGLQVPLGD